MKKAIFTLLFSCAMVVAFSQSTYYWVGGAAGAWATATSWNTALNGSGTSRSSANTADVLIFDGTNIGGSIPNTGTVSPDLPGSYTIGQLKIQNGADVVFKRSATGTGYVLINGDGAAGDDFSVDASSKLTLTSSTSGYAFYIGLGVLTTNLATGTIAGKVYVLDGGLASVNIRVPNTNSLNFVNGSMFYSNTSATSSYPFSNSSSTAVGAINFKAGSQFIYQGGNNPFSNSTHIPFILEKGSSFIMEAANVAAMFTNKVFGNVIVRNNATVTLAENFYGIDTLTINAGAAFYMRVSGTAPFSGNIINNGTFGAASPTTSNHVIMIGSVPQSIGGTGTFVNFGAFSVGTDADVTLNTNITIGSTATPPTSTVTGKLNTQTYTVNSTGTTVPGGFQFRAAATGVPSAGTITAGSYSVVLNATTYSSSINTANVVVGGLVTGTGIPANTYIVATSSSSSTFTISKAATASSPAPDGTIITITANPATFTTSNTAGADGSITTTGARTFGSGTNYVFNAATTAPFSTASTAGAGNVTFNANATTNRSNLPISGTLTLNAAKLTIQPTDTIRITSGNAIAGGSFSSSKYIATATSGANVGVLIMENFGTARTFPVGSATNYLPVTLTPTTADAFAVSVFEGITTDGTVNGTAMTAAQKAKVVNAVWTINRTSGNVDNCAVGLNWPASLEGSSFGGYGNSIGVARYSGTWGIVGGSGDNTANTATNSFSAFSPFGVGQLGFPLPVRLSNITATEQQGKVKIGWSTEAEVNVDSYTIERAIDGINFSAISSIAATGSRQYSAFDNTPSSVNYYRIKVVNKSGSIEYSNVVKIKLNNKEAEIAVYPNPVKGNVVSLQMTNLTKGKAAVKLFNNQGQQLFATTISYEGGSQLQSIVLPATIAKGVYRLVVTNDNKNLQQTILVN